MKIEDVPETHWMLLDKQRNVLFQSKNLADVRIECEKYPIEDVVIERKFTGIIY